MSDDVNRIMVRSNMSRDYVIRLARGITEPDDFADEFQILAGAGPTDTVKMLLVTPGGSVDTCLMITKAMAECEAHITGWIGPQCASAGSAIALACDDWEVDDMSSLMIHTGSYSSGWGKAKDVLACTMHQDKMIARFVRLTYTGFLTPEEIEQVIDGKELYFEVENGLVERLTAYAEYRDAQRLAMYEAAHNVEEEDEECVDAEDEVIVESPLKPKRQKKAA